MTEDAKKARRLQRAKLAAITLGKFGNPKRAAHELGIAESTLRKWVAEYVELKGYESQAQALYALGSEQSLHRGASVTETSARHTGNA